MTEKQNKDYLFVFLLLVIIVISFLILTPKVASMLFPQKRQMVLQSFISSTKQTNKIDPQKFWEFREFYSPGYFTFNRNGLTNTQIKTVENKTGISVDMNNVSRIFLSFTSLHLNSYEALVSAVKLSDVVNVQTLGSKETIFSNNNTLIYKDSTKRTHILFLKPLSEMERANGFFNYNDTDKSIVQGKNWLEVTTLDEK